MYSEDIRDIILERLTRESLRRICKDDGMPDRCTVERWMQADDAFAAKCARAREIHADHIADGMADIEDDVLAGAVDPAAARVVLSSQQWRLSKLASKKYGDKLETTIQGGDKPVQIIGAASDADL